VHGDRLACFQGSRRCFFDHALVPRWLEIMTDPNRPEQRAPGNGRVGTAFQRTPKTKPNVDIYGRFEQGVALVLLLLVSSVIVVGLAHLTLTVKQEVFFPLETPLEPYVFKDVFGATLTALIGLELNHTVLGVLQRKESVVQLRTVVLIAIIAMARKFLILDVTALEPIVIIALAFTILALGSVYWLLRG
jgi:uncharacterized membrane protein (DUF373 family)